MIYVLLGSRVDVALYHRVRRWQGDRVDTNTESLGNFGSHVRKRSRGRENSRNGDTRRSKPVMNGGTEELEQVLLMNKLRPAPALRLNDFHSAVLFANEISTQIFEAVESSVVCDGPPS